MWSLRSRSLCTGRGNDGVEGDKFLCTKKWRENVFGAIPITLSLKKTLSLGSHQRFVFSIKEFKKLSVLHLHLNFIYFKGHRIFLVFTSYEENYKICF